MTAAAYPAGSVGRLLAGVGLHPSAPRVDHAADLRRRLADPRLVVERLGLAEGARPQHGGVLVRCPAHADRTPSCSVRVAADGTLACRCFGCDWSGDVLGLVAVVNQLTTSHDFPKVLELAAELAGTTLDAEPLPPPPRPTPPPAPRSYPPQAEVAALWDASLPVTTDVEVSAWLASRGLAPAAVELADLARALPVGAQLPRWAFTRQWGAWTEAGYRCLVPLFDELGQLRSLRARRVVARDDGGPKALPASGYRSSGVVMASAGLTSPPTALHIYEGEPDFLLGATAHPDVAVVGVISGAWSAAIAAEVPDGCRVSIRTHRDLAGDKYAAAIAATLRGRCLLFRGSPPLDVPVRRAA